MTENSLKQLKKILKQSNNALILIPENYSGDCLSGSFALSHFLQEINIDSTLSIPKKNIPEKFQFLPSPKDIQNELLGIRDFVLSFKTTFNKITNIRTAQDKEETRIYITPEHGSIDPRDFSFIPSRFKYDIIFALGSPNKESFGKVFEKNPDIFYEVPIINIDNSTENEDFGQINIVDIKASSVSEIVYAFIQETQELPINKDIALCLLTGIIHSTKSFQSKKTTPKSLKFSAELIQSGADQQEIIKHLFKTQPLNILKLWGRIMAKANMASSKEKIIWAYVSSTDLNQTNTTTRDIPLVIDKILNNYSEGEIAIIFYTAYNSKIKAIIKTKNNSLFKDIQKKSPWIQKGDFLQASYQNLTEKDLQEKLLTESFTLQNLF